MYTHCRPPPPLHPPHPSFPTPSADELLVHWHKVATPWMRYPHSTALEAWRDPFFVQGGPGGREWVMLLCSGVRGRGGTALIYRSPKLTHGARASPPIRARSCPA
jgi:hypothetical protein